MYIKRSLIKDIENLLVLRLFLSFDRRDRNAHARAF